ncbi:glycosyltransferase family 4 protein [Prosthecobacter sp.]|jgi:glycosyltransferase involved in cell wall biosynthesis|uniref:glycosyltransferase family 4 protein n=1 Tax=Prosthecobacter sp. TaxID=1965333 RepID=UPI0037C80BD4
MKIAIASCTHPASVGGLAAYQRELASGLQKLCSVDGKFVSVQQVQTSLACSRPNGAETLNWPVTDLMALSAWKKQHKFFMRVATKRLLVGLADKLSCAMNTKPSWKSALAGVDALHFVGTGWDIIGYPLWREARAAGVPFTIWPAVHPDSWGDDMFDIRLYQKADTIFCQSDYERNHLAARGVATEKLARCGLPPMCHQSDNSQEFRRKLDIGERLSVLFLGRRDVGKGYPALLEAWPLVLEKCPEAVLILAGPGPVDEARLAKFPASALRDLGCPSEQQKADAYAACDAFCLPSAHESFGIVYVEAWSFGKPVVCGTAPASRELVEDNVTGLWANQQPQQLANNLLRLLMNHDYRHSLGAAGLHRQLSSFTVESMVNQHLSAWQTTALN